MELSKHLSLRVSVTKLGNVLLAKAALPDWQWKPFGDSDQHLLEKHRRRCTLSKSASTVQSKARKGKEKIRNLQKRNLWRNLTQQEWGWPNRIEDESHQQKLEVFVWWSNSLLSAIYFGWCKTVQVRWNHKSCTSLKKKDSVTINSPSWCHLLPGNFE